MSNIKAIANLQGDLKVFSVTNKNLCLKVSYVDVTFFS